MSPKLAIFAERSATIPLRIPTHADLLYIVIIHNPDSDNIGDLIFFTGKHNLKNTQKNGKHRKLQFCR